MAGDLTFAAPARNIWSETNELSNNLAKLLRDEQTCDVMFIVGQTQEKFKAHSLILKARCEDINFHERTNLRSPLVITHGQFRPAVFQKVLEYIYTGKMLFTAGTSVETLRIAHHLRIPSLVRASEQFLLEQLSVSNCCEFFMDSLSARFHSEDCNDESLVAKCEMFIEENAARVVQTDGFLNLSKDALIKLISSDEFALPEEEVWYAVLNWSKHQAKVKETVHNWTDSERESVCKYLSDVIGYVRILLIDSKIFAEQVEPTGAVPIELSLQRYRYAAVPDTFQGNNESHRRRRVRHKMFLDTSILEKDNVKYQKTLNEWFGNEHQQWHLLYQARRDGFSAKTFHQKCDGVGQTYTLVKGFNGNICGGFTDVPWTNEGRNGKYFASDRSFVFTLVNSDGIQPTKFDVLRPKYAILCHASLGPTFGAGADLCLSDRCNANMNSYSNLPHSYGGSIASDSLLMGGRNFKVANYEVFCQKEV